MSGLKFIYRMFYKAADRITQRPALKYLVTVLAISLFLVSLFFKIPDFKIKDWTYVKPKPKGLIMDIHFQDDKKGWMVVDKAGILYTRSGGKRWQWQWRERSRPPYLTVKRLYFFNRETGWALGKALVEEKKGIFASYPLILRTVDSGRTWDSHILQDADMKDVALNDVFFTDSRHGWAVGFPGVLLKSDDGGETWEIKARNMNLTHKSSQVSFESVFFIDPKTGWVCAQEGLVQMTQDGGITWSAQSCGEVLNLKRIFFITKEKGWVTGDGGSIFYTEDGGRNWQTQFETKQPNFYFYDLYFSDFNNGWAIGGEGRLFRTTDGGRNWDLECTFIEEKITNFNTGGKTWHSFLNRLVSPTDHQKSFSNNWMISVAGKEPLVLWVAGEKEGLFTYPARGGSRFSMPSIKKVIYLLVSLIFLLGLLWANGIQRNKRGFLNIPASLRRRGLKLAWFSFQASAIPCALTALLILISYYLSLYYPNTFLFRLLMNLVNPVLSWVMTVSAAASFLIGVTALVVLKNDDNLSQQLNLSFLGIFLSALVLVAARSWLVF